MVGVGLDLPLGVTQSHIFRPWQKRAHNGTALKIQGPFFVEGVASDCTKTLSKERADKELAKYGHVSVMRRLEALGV